MASHEKVNFEEVTPIENSKVVFSKKKLKIKITHSKGYTSWWRGWTQKGRKSGMCMLFGKTSPWWWFIIFRYFKHLRTSFSDCGDNDAEWKRKIKKIIINFVLLFRNKYLINVIIFFYVVYDIIEVLIIVGNFY